MGKMFSGLRTRSVIVAALGVIIVAATVFALVFRDGGGSDERSETILRVALASLGAEELDPSADLQAGYRYYGQLYDPLIGADDEGRPDVSAGVLESWSASADGTSYVLKLRPDLRWHDGTEVVAGDIEFSLNHYRRAAAACAVCGSLDDVVGGISVSGDLEVTVKLLGPDTGFITRLGPVQEAVPLLPWHYFNRAGGEGIAETPVGSGPWRFRDRVKGDWIEFGANDDYWDRENVPRFDRLRLSLVADPGVRVAMLLSDSVDMAPVRIDQVESLKQQGFGIGGPRNVIETALRFFQSYDSSFITSKLEFRQALALSMDVSGMIEELYPAEAATRAYGSVMFVPSAEGFTTGLAPYAYDPDRARELLGEAGYSGEKVSLLSIPVYDLPEIPAMNAMIIGGWRDIGIDAEIVPSTYGPVKARFAARPQKFDDLAPAPVFHGGHVNSPGGILNAINRYLTSSEQSLLGYHTPEEGDRILADLLATPEGPVRTEMLTDLNSRLQQEYWAVPIVWRHEVWGLSPRIESWRPQNGTSAYLRFETVRPVD